MSKTNLIITDLPNSTEANFLDRLTIEEQEMVVGGSAIALGIFANNDAISGAGAGISGPTQIKTISVIAAPGFSQASIFSRYSSRFG